MAWFRSLLLCVAASVALGACASVNYTEPQDGDRARVRFAVGQSLSRAGGTVALYDENAIVYGFTDANCADGSHWMTLLDGYLVRPDPRRMGMPLWDYQQNAAKEFYVSTATDLNVMFVGDMATWGGVSTTTYYCPVFVGRTLR